MSDPTSDLVGHSVLLIDDSDDNRFVLGRWMRRNGLTVAEAATGGAGLELAREQPDVIVLDVRMPDMSGFEVARRLRDDPVTRTIPILQRSSIAIAEGERLEGLASGADAYLTEPISESMLIAVIRSLLRFGRLQRQLEAALSIDVSGVFDVQLEGGVVRWSDSLARMHRLDPTEFRGTIDHVLELVHPDDRAAVTSIGTSPPHEHTGSDRDRPDEPFEIRYRMVRADGSIGWLEARGSLFRDAEGRAQRLQGIAMDVTEREEERRRNAQLRRLAEMLSAGSRAEDVLAIGRRTVEELGLDLIGPMPAAEVPAGEHAVDLVADVVVAGRALGALRRDGSQVAPADVSQATAVLQQVAVAHDRALRYETEAANAAALQRALLPDELPHIDGWVSDAYYATASDSERLGGDFYDMVRLEESVVVVIGDVAGHGLVATRQMGALRSLLRTCIAMFGGDPARILSEAAALAERVGGGDAPFVTAAVASTDLTTGRSSVATAGHPPPIVRRGDVVEQMEVPVGPPLGIAPDAEYVAAPFELAVGDWFAFFTDGVFERRDQFLDDAVRASLPQLPAAPTAADVVRAADATAAGRRPTNDDRAVVLLRRTG